MFVDGTVFVQLPTKLLLQLVNPLFDSLKQASQSWWPFLRSNAEPVSMASRGVSSLSGRDEIWKGTLEYLKSNPKYLIAGQSIGFRMD